VYKALWKQTIVAVKAIDVNEDISEEDLSFEQEVTLLSSLKHPNLVSFYGVSASEKRKLMST